MTDLSELDAAGEFLRWRRRPDGGAEGFVWREVSPVDAEYRDYAPVCVVRLTKSQVDALVVEHLRPLPTAGGY